MPAQNNKVKPSTAPVHLGQTFGVTPNPNATRPATIAAIGNPYGGMQGPRLRRMEWWDRQAWEPTPGPPTAWLPGQGSLGRHSRRNRHRYARKLRQGRLRPGFLRPPRLRLRPRWLSEPVSTDLEVLSKPPVQYTSEARQLRVQGDVVLRVTFLASGQVVVQGVVHGLGHGLDEEARRVAQQIRFRPATRNGQPVDLTTTITITFQLA